MIGTKSAFKIYNECMRNMPLVYEHLRGIPQSLEKIGYTFDEYVDAFERAFLTFKFQRVYCPRKRRLVSLNVFEERDLFSEEDFKSFGAIVNHDDLNKKCTKFDMRALILKHSLKPEGLNFLGPIIPQDLVVKICTCDYDPITKEKFQRDRSKHYSKLENDDLNGQPVDLQLQKQFTKIKLAPADENAKDSIESENLMNDIFAEFEINPAAFAGPPARRNAIASEADGHSNKPTMMDKEVLNGNSAPNKESDILHDLAELEEQLKKTEIEAVAAPSKLVAVPQKRAPVAPVNPLTQSKTTTLVRSLYTHKKRTNFNFQRNLKNEDLQGGRQAPRVTNGKLHFYWIDIQEEDRKKSLVHLYGKVRLENGQCASACLTVENMQRTYYFIKRENKTITLANLENELSQKIQKRHSNIFKEMKLKQVTDKYYAFELDIARGQVEAIEVSYSFNLPPLDLPFEADNYKGILGKSYKTTELFVITNRLMGPCWLEVENFTQLKHKETSSCEYEFRVPSAHYVQQAAAKECGEPPKCKLVSVSLVREKEAANEIKAITCLFHDDYDIENVQSDLKLIPMIFIQVEQGRMSIFKNLLSQCFGANVFCFPTESTLLNAFSMKLNQLDPDIIVGHDINNLFFEPFIARAERTNQLGLLSKLSKSVRDSAEMKRVIKTFGLKKIRAVSYGRMVCDTLLCCQEHIRETNYELDYLAEKHLNEANICEYRVPSSDELQMAAHLIDENLMNAHLSLALSQKLQLVQLNKQLTNVAGCFWYQCFQNMPFVRNDMMLMHAFHGSGYLLPDKHQTKWDESKKSKNKGKAKYEGGLVLEPKCRLYQDMILLLDFNAFYPSIIREYKICFTTVKRDYNNQDEEDADGEENLNKMTAGTRIPEHDPQTIQDNAHNQILPKIVERLTNLRKHVQTQVKSAMTQLEKDHLERKQKAYKLVANIMYGCLGLQSSRFYSREIASLITAFGRNIMRNSVAICTKMGFDIIYGDTGSIMINSREKHLSSAIQTGLIIKKAINKNSKLLEIDIHGIFRSLLLLKKKKYAADKLQNLDDVRKGIKGTEPKFAIELKGLDIVRRDWSGLTKMCGEYLVQHILNIQTDVDSINSNIYRYFADFMSDLKSGRISLDSFVIFKQLTKNLNEYNDKGQPHVVVAKKMHKNMGYTNEQLVKHFIPYIICEGKGNLAGTSFSERAYHPHEVRQLGLKPDIRWYTNNQLLNPIVRLVEYLPGFDQDKLATLLEIDKQNLGRATELKTEATFAHEEGLSVLHAADEQEGTSIEWKCVENHRNTFKMGESSLQCQHKKPDGTQCSKAISLGTLKNLAVQATRAQMMEYNNTVFALQRRLNDQPSPSPALPVMEIEFAKKQEEALSDAVTRVNTRLNNLDRLFDGKAVTEPELKAAFQECKTGVQALRNQSQYSKVQFGAKCSKIDRNRPSCKHYQLIGLKRPDPTDF